MRTPSNIYIIVLDACRADKFGCYGFTRQTTPIVDALAADPDAVIFRRHYVQGTWTKPSTASLFSGLLVRQHGVVDGEIPSQDSRTTSSFRTQALAPQISTLAERMRDAGFATFAVLQNQHLASNYGFGRGFTTYQALSYDVHGGDYALVKRFIDLVGSTPGRQFGYLHVRGCHYPFEPSGRDGEYIQQYGFPYDEAARRKAGVDLTTAAVKDQINEGILRLTADDIRFLNLLYEARLHRSDGFVGSVLTKLRETGRYDDSLIMVTADHGEELYDHHGYGHGHALWEVLMHIPLIVKFPHGCKPPALGHEVDALTAVVDVMPSLLAFSGQSPPQRTAGLPVFMGASRDYIVSENVEFGEWAVIRDGYKLIEKKPEPLLFNLGNDPTESANLAANDASRVAAMRTFARQVFSAATQESVAAPVIDEHLPAGALENLRNLGYLK